MTTTTTEGSPRANDAQATLWNGAAGRGWVEMQALLDAMFLPIEQHLAQAVHQAGARRVLDVGCGTGATTLAMARRLGPGAQCTGVDLSAPMVEAARRRAADEGSPARFLVADAQTHAFEPASHDAIASRFGVMFFDDPVRAFTHLRRASTPDASMHLVAWRPAAENLFMTAAERAARPLLPDLPVREGDGPGQFAFDDAARVASILQASGWDGVSASPLDVACTLPVEAVPDYIAWMGPVGQRLQSADPGLRARLVDAVRAGYAPFIEGDTLRFTAACWDIRARAGR